MHLMDLSQKNDVKWGQVRCVSQVLLSCSYTDWIYFMCLSIDPETFREESKIPVQWPQPKWIQSFQPAAAAAATEVVMRICLPNTCHTCCCVCVCVHVLVCVCVPTHLLSFVCKKVCMCAADTFSVLSVYVSKCVANSIYIVFVAQK